MENMNSDMFSIIDENGITREAEIITTIEVDGIDYVIYSISVDSDNSDVLVSRLITDENGDDMIEDIEDENEREKMFKIVQEIMNL